LFESRPDYPNVAYFYGASLYEQNKPKDALVVWDLIPEYESHDNVVIIGQHKQLLSTMTSRVCLQRYLKAK
jgi:hypothetical protein